MPKKPKSVGDDAWTRDPDAIATMISGTAQAMISQWKGVPALVKAGRLVKEPGGWYRVTDFTAVKDIGKIVQTMEFDPETQRLTRVQFEKINMRELNKMAALVPRRR